MTQSTNAVLSQVQPGLSISDLGSQDLSRGAYPVVPFIIKPYLQLGDNDCPSSYPQILLIWHTERVKSDWTVQLCSQGDEWVDCEEVESQTIKVNGIETHLRHQCLLSDVGQSPKANYRLLWQGIIVFQSEFRVPKLEGEKLRIAVVGDLGDGGADSKAVVHRLYSESPDLTVLAGDVVYKSGTFSEYLANYFPVMNCDHVDPSCGAPFIRSHLVTASVGNHDVKVPKGYEKQKASGKKSRRTELFAYDIFFCHPENGPRGLTKKHLDLDGSNGKYSDLIDEVGSNIISKTNFHYSYGDSFWLHLDGNAYLDWTETKLRKWVSSALSRASQFIWKFVVLHQPPFTSDLEYWCEQKQRLLCELFEAHGVDIVFSGHSHVYERTYPLKYSVKPGSCGRLVQDNGIVDGHLRLDRKYDGKTVTKTDGVIYITTGAGGKPLDEEHKPASGSKPPFTDILDLDNFSVSMLEIEGKKLLLRQVNTEGEVIDQIVLEK